jgi:Tol biopolymer transport system component
MLVGVSPGQKEGLMHRSSLLSLVVLTALATTAYPASASPEPSSQSSGLLVFSADATGSAQLYTVHPDGSGLTQITHLKNAEATQADWSPDGEHIAFELDKPTSVRVAVIGYDGSGMRVLRGLAPANGASAQPAFAANGRRLYYERWDGVSDDTIYSVNLQGKHPRRLTNPPEHYGDTEPSPSPDGTMLSFVRLGEQDGKSALMVLNLKTGKVRQLTPFSADVAIKTGWAPNSKRIGFSRDAYSLKDGISANIVTVKPDGTGRRKVTSYAGGKVHAFFGSYSPDGQWIVYREEHTDRWPLMLVRPDGSDAHPILEVDGLRPRGTDWGTGPGVG